MKSFNYIKCTHKEPLSIFCDGKSCWKAGCLSSRLIEKHMTGKKTREFMISHPLDSFDFLRCVYLVQTNGWESRLEEMRYFSLVWSRIVKLWYKLKGLLEQNKLLELNKKIVELGMIENTLKTFEGPIESFVFNKNYVIGSHLVQPHLQYDEENLAPCVILENFPSDYINYYNTDGSLRGSKYSKLSDDLHICTSKLSDNLIKTILKALDTRVQLDSEIWYTYDFDYCPHIISTSELTDPSIMYFAQVFNLGGEQEIGYCLISFESTHPLDPSGYANPTKLDKKILYQGYNWIISPQPVKLNTLYISYGLLNAYEDDTQPVFEHFEELKQIKN
jgi:hypothetical protein